MRKLFSLIFLLATPVVAEDFHLETKVVKAEIFGFAGLVTRETELKLPAGQHKLHLRVTRSALEYGVPSELSFAGSGSVSLVSISKTSDLVAPNALPKSAALLAAERRLDAAQRALREAEEAYEAVEARKHGAELQLQLLKSVAEGRSFDGDGTVSAEELSGVIGVLASASETAALAVSAAATELQRQEAALDVLGEAVELAERAVDVLTPSFDGFAEMVVNVDVRDAFDGRFEIEMYDNIGWAPAYRLSLSQNAKAGVLTLGRNAVVSRATGGRHFEDWENVHIVLSTAQINDDLATWEPREQLYGLRKQDFGRTKSVSGYAQREPVVEPIAEVLEDRLGTGARFAGQTLRFDLGAGHDLKWTEDGVEILIDQLEIPVELYALANAARDDFGFLYSDLTNTTGGLLLAGRGNLYRDGAFVGNMDFPQMAPGQMEPIGLGKLYGLQIDRRTLDSTTGDSGFITSSTEQSYNYRTTITSNLDYDIDLKLLDVVPTSENDDLVVAMQARPRPDEKSRDGKRGVLEWDLPIDAGQTTVVDFGYSMKWPAEMQLAPK